MKKFLQAIGRAFNLTVLTDDEYKKLNAAPETPITQTEEPPTEPDTLLDYAKTTAILTAYDATRVKIAKDALGHEDTRINTFGFYEFKNYMNYVEQLAKEKDITLKGICFIKGVYTAETAPNESLIGYECLMHLPTTLIDGKETLIDLPSSTKETVMSFKNIMAANGYQWRYDSKEDYLAEPLKSKEAISSSTLVKLRSSSIFSSAGNRGTIAPPY